MRKAIKRGIASFVSVWAFTHVFYAFVMLDWSPFTEWEPLSRAMVLFTALTLASMHMIFELMDKQP